MPDHAASGDSALTWRRQMPGWPPPPVGPKSLMRVEFPEKSEADDSMVLIPAGKGGRSRSVR